MARTHRGRNRHVFSLCQAQDSSVYEKIIQGALDHGKDKDFEALLKYLKFIRNKVTDVRLVDTETVYALCRVKLLPDIEEFVKKPHAADLDDVTERVYDDENWVAARMMCKLTKNWGKLAAVHVRLGDLEEALKCAKQADRPETWKVVLFACVDAREFRFAQICGHKVIVETGELPDIIKYYEKRGYFQEVRSGSDYLLNRFPSLLISHSVPLRGATVHVPHRNFPTMKC